MIGEIICGYPCVGKTTIGSQGGNFILDLESSLWSHDGEEALDPDIWIPRYCEAAISLAHNSFTVLTSTHEGVIKYFEERVKDCDVPVMIFAPKLSMRDEWIDRAKCRYEDDRSNKNLRAYEHIQQHFEEKVAILQKLSLPCFCPKDTNYIFSDCIREMSKYSRSHDPKDLLNIELMERN